MKLEELASIKECVLSEHNMAEDHKAPRIMVSMGTCGITAGSAEVLSLLKASFRDKPDVTVTEVGCLGMCWMEPLIQVECPGQDALIFGNLTPEKALEMVKKHIPSV